MLVEENKDHFFLMHLSYGRDKPQRKRLWEYALKNHVIGLDQKTVTENWTTLNKSKRNKTNRYWKGQFNNFCEKMDKGDYVVILNGISSILGIAKVTEKNHRYIRSLRGFNESNPNRFFDHIRTVKWILQYPWSGQPLSQVLVFNGTLNRVWPASPTQRWKVLTKLQV